MLSFDAIDEIKQTIEFQDWLPGNLSDGLDLRAFLNIQTQKSYKLLILGL